MANLYSMAVSAMGLSPLGFGEEAYQHPERLHRHVPFFHKGKNEKKPAQRWIWQICPKLKNPKVDP